MSFRFDARMQITFFLLFKHRRQQLRQQVRFRFQNFALSVLMKKFFVLKIWYKRFPLRVSASHYVGKSNLRLYYALIVEKMC